MACQVLATAPSDQQQQERAGHPQRRAILAGELAQPVAGARRARLHRLVGQVVLHVARQAAGGLVPPRPVLLQALHHDPVQLAPHQLRQPVRLGLARRRDLRQHGPSCASRTLGRGGSSSLISRTSSCSAAVRSRSRPSGVVPVKQLVEQHAQRVDVAARVHAEGVHLRLLGAHVLERADQRRRTA